MKPKRTTKTKAPSRVGSMRMVRRRRQESALGIVVGDMWHEAQKLASKLNAPEARIALEVHADGAVSMVARWHDPQRAHEIDGEWARYVLVWNNRNMAGLVATEMARSVVDKVEIPNDQAEPLPPDSERGRHSKP